jgi:hypothetical protein
MSQVIYARVPDGLKGAVDEYAGERGVTLTSAVTDLLGRGLEAVTDAPSIAETERQLGEAKERMRERESAFAAAQGELTALRSLAQRAQRRVGSCPQPNCGKPITGVDLLTTGSCRACGGTLSQLIDPSTYISKGPGVDQPGQGLNERDFLLLLGAIGAVLGVAYLAAQS